MKPAVAPFPSHSSARRLPRWPQAVAWLASWLMAFALCGPARAETRPDAPVSSSSAAGWVATWTASPQPTWDREFPFPTNLPAALRDQTLRQVARVSLGGSRLRLMLSNAYGSQALTVGRVTVALSEQGSAIRRDTLRTVTFAGRTAATIPPGAPLLSDPIDLPVPDLARVTVSIHLPGDTPMRTFHWDGRQTAWIAAGDQTAAPTIDPHRPSTGITTARALLAGIEVEAAQGASAVAVIGDSITDGNGATVDADARWPDFLAARLAAHRVAVINAGISGGRLLVDGMGVNALARFGRDVLDQPGVRTAIVLLGINDISWPGTLFDPDGRRPALDALQQGFRQLAAQAHRRGVRIVGVTLTPFEGALQGTPLDNYYAADKDALRERLNAWIRDSGVFDAVLDFDLWSKDAADAARFDPRFDSGDHLHPGDAGNRALADAIPLGLLFGR